MNREALLNWYILGGVLYGDADVGGGYAFSQIRLTSYTPDTYECTFSGGKYVVKTCLLDSTLDRYFTKRRPEFRRALAGMATASKN